jgi:hypothetical protein
MVFGGPRDTPEISLRDRQRSSMRPTVRLTPLAGGGFRLEGVAATPIDAVPDEAGFRVEGGGVWRLTWIAAERGWQLHRLAEGGEEEVGQTTASALPEVASPISVLLADGRLFRLASIGLSEPRVELARWDVSGPYVVGRPASGAWELERTAAGMALDAPPELWILISAELGRLDGWS